MKTNAQKTIARVRNEATFNDIADVQKSLDALAGVGINWHPDDPVEDIQWNPPLTDEDIQNMRWISWHLWDFFLANPLFDIYDEMMRADVRAHGKASPFYDSVCEEQQ